MTRSSFTTLAPAHVCASLEDVLFAWRVTGHYRYFPSSGQNTAVPRAALKS
ncbi:hypothetical protein [Chloracidobacterium aggregatum]|uniref:hypothetical protein n=1 Tax=Chloracidobacterium aggregatum TaxID=2851959 RepID=UPI001B8B34C4|nr:hypothetical protein [Chloracidobacterium aggregatum]QUV89440.1 hypothetical protein J8C07_12170 [Chloracidobacterium sp. S]QUV92558.1 hypothetical protein J8C04_12440 [Chloracidobacterium sp. A]QUV98239.1 hypothetical protein J8C00_14700 [Chloracidobacterium sp. E]